MREFPDFAVPGFDMKAYNERFKKNNVIIHASSKNVSYPEHWGCLSIKCAFGGNEYYESGKHRYTVNNDNFLIFNEGKIYSSYIFSKNVVESFTVNFSASFTKMIMDSLLRSPENIMDNSLDVSCFKVEFIEKLYKHDNMVSPVISKLYKLSLDEYRDDNKITETYYPLLERLIRQQQHVYKEVRKIKAMKHSTRLELYKRLHYAKDFIDSCYMLSISLDKLGEIACLNSAYLLRQFKNYFGITPYRYIMHRRLMEAKSQLENSANSVTEICFNVGYEDLSSFIKLFKGTFHLPPEKYQLTHTKKSVFTC